MSPTIAVDSTQSQSVDLTHPAAASGFNRTSPRSASSSPSQHQQQPFHPKSPTDGGGWGASQLADQAVITTTTADGGLSPELITCDLKGRVAVVVQTPHQPRIELERNPRAVSPRCTSANRSRLASQRASASVGAFPAAPGCLCFWNPGCAGDWCSAAPGNQGSRASDRCSSQATRALR